MTNKEFRDKILKYNYIKRMDDEFSRVTKGKVYKIIDKDNMIIRQDNGTKWIVTRNDIISRHWIFITDKKAEELLS